jgi:hypothetical protein
MGLKKYRHRQNIGVHKILAAKKYWRRQNIGFKKYRHRENIGVNKILASTKY